MRTLLFFLFFSFLFAGCIRDDKVPTPSVQFVAPEHFPPLEYDLFQNPITRKGFELGKKLFMDGILSRDGSISCASCHISTSGFTQHGHALSHGIDNRLTKRNSQPIQNLAWNKTFSWDGGVFHLDLFPPVPITNPNEMEETVANVIEKLRQDPEYPRLFREAFGAEDIETALLFKALSQFQLMCISANSPYDRYVKGEETLSAEALSGEVIFEAKCSSCHSGVLQTDQSFRNNGLPIGNPTDYGRGLITGLEEDHFKFRVPSLRNWRFTFPYMHDGRFKTIDEVLEHYGSGVVSSPTLDPLLQDGIPLTADERDKLKAFLETLNDEEFIHNPLLEVF